MPTLQELDEYNLHGLCLKFQAGHDGDDHCMFCSTYGIHDETFCPRIKSIFREAIYKDWEENHNIPPDLTQFFIN